ncbi:MAG: DUF1634 domain-containing protein [Chlorobiaceae bacterium]|jgi:hypothetical protein|nr:DUF1634 domain-containing protein [Chlorobiaceae bacterium]NTW63169.1 DUF1634 domain-containing protein [Chlorobiaceae bacterium]
MKDTSREKNDEGHVQFVYARVLDFVSHTGMLFIAAGYFVYVLQLLPLSVSISAVADNWHLSASDMQQKLHVPSGWSFMGSMTDLLKGDVLSYTSILFLCMATILCLVFAAKTFFREKNYIYTIIAVLQVLVLLFAASGTVGR